MSEWLLFLINGFVAVTVYAVGRYYLIDRPLRADRDKWRRRAEAITSELKGYYGAVKYEPGYLTCYSVAKEIERMVKAADEAVKETPE